eukprot:g2964.t1
MVKGIRKIGKGAFYECGLKSLVLKEGVEEIGDKAFRECYSLKSATLVKGIRSIGNWAFADTAITSITMKEGLEEIGHGAFYDCSSLESVTLVKGIRSIGGAAFEGSAITSITMKEGLEEIGGGAFGKCHKLRSITFESFPKRKIGDKAFIDCPNLRTIVCGKKTVAVPDDAFRTCTDLDHITYKDPTLWIRTTFRVTEYTVEEGVKEIGEKAFFRCGNLERIKMVKGIRKIGGAAFRYSGIKSLVLKEGVEDIGDCAFCDCYSLKSATLVKGIRSIGLGAFAHTAITSITIKEGLEEIGLGAFWKCHQLRSITFESFPKKIGDRAFLDCTNLRTIVCGKKRVAIPDDAFRTSKHWLDTYKDPTLWIRTTFRDKNEPFLVDVRVEDAAAYAFQNYYKKPYPPPSDDVDEALASKMKHMDFEAQHKVERPNHSMCDAVRKALLVPHVVDAIRQSPLGEHVDFNDDFIAAIQVALIFEVSGRDSDIGHAEEDNDVFMGYHKKSCEHFKEYATRIGLRYRDICLNALEHMYMEPKTPTSTAPQRVMEICHDLDLFRCYEKEKMMGKIDKFTLMIEDREVARDIARRAEGAILQTGDRLFCSAFGNATRGYDPMRFPECSHDAKACIHYAVHEIGTRAWDPYVDGELLTLDTKRPNRLITSEFGKRLSELNAKWRTIDMHGSTFFDLDARFLKARMYHYLQEFVNAYCKMKSDKAKACGDESTCETLGLTTSKQEEHAEGFVEELREEVNRTVEDLHDRDQILEVVAIVLWTCTKTLDVGGGKTLELCSMLNEAVRCHSGPSLEHCVHLIAMLQHFLNAERRGMSTPMPEGPHSVSGKTKGETGWSTTKNIVYRGGELPRRHVSFFEKLERTGRPYRAPHLLSTSFDKSVALRFMRNTRGCKVLWIIKVPDEGCMHANYLAKKYSCKREQEYLFSAFSAFRVLKVEKSPRPCRVATPHKITLLAVPDNLSIGGGVPTAPWC